MPASFETVHSTEPHRLRRKKIIADYPQIRHLFGYDKRTAWVTAAVVVVQLIVARELSRQTLNWDTTPRLLLFAACALLFGAILNHWLAMSIHEATHNLAFQTPRQNIGLGLLANVPMVLPVAMTFRRYHLTHHAQLGVIGQDTDLPHPWEVRYVANSTPLKLLWWIFYAFIYLIRGATFVRQPNRLELLNVVMMAAVNTGIGFTLGWNALIYLTLCTVFAHGMHPVAAHFIHEHYIFKSGQETHSYYDPLNWVTFNVGYHNEHHDFPNIPGWKLPEYRQLTLSHYESLTSHTSWTRVLWNFITNRELGFGSRIVRPSVHAQPQCDEVNRNDRRPPTKPALSLSNGLGVNGLGN